MPAQLSLAQTAEQLERADQLPAEFQEFNYIPGLSFSAGKPMTSVAIGLLVESGRLDLDAPVLR